MFLFKKRIHCTYISTFFAKLSYNLPPKWIKKSWLMCSRLCLLTQIADIVRATTTTSTTASASSISICWIHAIRVSTSLKLNISDWLSETTEGWNTPKYSLNRWLSLKVHHWATINSYQLFDFCSDWLSEFLTLTTVMISENWAAINIEQWSHQT